MNSMGDSDKQKIVLFMLDELHYALYLSVVERVVHAVEIIPLPKAPDIVTGVINFHGKILPVINIRKRFQLPASEMELENQFIIANTTNRFVVLVVDSVIGVHEFEMNQIIDLQKSLPYTEYISGITKIETDIVLISDLEKFLSLDEEKKLNGLLSGKTE